MRVATKTTRAKRNARQLINCWRDSLLARDAAVRRRRRRPRMRGPNVRDLRRASGASCLFARARARARSLESRSSHRLRKLHAAEEREICALCAATPSSGSAGVVVAPDRPIIK